jgi:cytidine deaminase
MAEFNLDATVLIANADGEQVGEYLVRDLLPASFGDDDLTEARE